MSAIWGAVSFSTLLSENTERAMRQIYETRCRLDRFAALCAPDSFFGCGLQYITRESASERLPIYDAEGRFYFSADCLLDNRKELALALSASDTEPDGSLMYLAYRKWGIDCVRRFRGLFSMAVYETSSKRLYLAADQTASRCLYYYRSGAAVLFSTLLDPIAAVCPDIACNDLYLKDFLTAPGLMPNIVSDETPYAGIRKLNPGCYVTVTPGSLSETRYWAPSLPAPHLRCRSAAEYGDSFVRLYSDCVADALRCNGGIGIAMSSGLDSATVGALAADRLGATGRRLMTYTYVPSLPARDSIPGHVTDEREAVRAIADMHPAMSVHFLDNRGCNCLSELDDTLRVMEFPFKAYVNMPNLREIYQSAADDGCKVLLTGQCGNSTVSHGYIDDVLYDLYSTGHPFRFLHDLNHYSKTVRESRKKALIGCIRYFRHANERYRDSSFSYRPANVFLTERILDGYPLEARYRQSGNTLLERLPTAHTQYLSGLYKASLFTYMGELETKMGLAHGIIIRDPTKDMRMLQFCCHLPYRYFAYGGTPRWLIRGNLAGLLPAPLLNDWMRYGVQNADYLSRIRRDLTSLLPLLQTLCADSRITKWTDTALLHSRLSALSAGNPEEGLRDFDDLAYLLIAQQFCRQHSF